MFLVLTAIVVTGGLLSAAVISFTRKHHIT